MAIHVTYESESESEVPVDLFDWSSSKFSGINFNTNDNKDYEPEMLEDEGKEFDKANVYTRYVITVLILICCFFILVYFAKIGYNAYTDLDTGYADSELIGDGKIAYIDGEEQPVSVSEDAGEVIDTYFKVIRSGKNYGYLNEFCTDKNSTYYNAYRNYLSEVKSNYDINDCYARALKIMGKSFYIKSMNKVIEKDGIYYCYCNLYVPTNDNVRDYVYLYKYNIIKYFKVHKISEENILIFITKSMKNDNIGTSDVNYCIKMKRNKYGDLRICDDSGITTNCLKQFTNLLYSINNILQKDLDDI